MTEPTALHLTFDEAWAKRQAMLAAKRCGEGHSFRRAFSWHLGSWRTCKGCGLIEDIPTLTVVRP